MQSPINKIISLETELQGDIFHQHLNEALQYNNGEPVKLWNSSDVNYIVHFIRDAIKHLNVQYSTHRDIDALYDKFNTTANKETIEILKNTRPKHRTLKYFIRSLYNNEYKNFNKK